MGFEIIFRLSRKNLAWGEKKKPRSRWLMKKFTECWLQGWVLWSMLTCFSDNRSAATELAVVSLLRSISGVVCDVSRCQLQFSSKCVRPYCDLECRPKGECRYFWSVRCIGEALVEWDILLWSRCLVSEGVQNCWNSRKCFWIRGFHWRNCCYQYPLNDGWNGVECCKKNEDPLILIRISLQKKCFFFKIINCHILVPHKSLDHSAISFMVELCHR